MTAAVCFQTERPALFFFSCFGLMCWVFIALNISSMTLHVIFGVCFQLRVNLRVKTILSQEIADLDVYGSRVKGLLRKCSLRFPGLQLNSYCKTVRLDWLSGKQHPLQSNWWTFEGPCDSPVWVLNVCLRQLAKSSR